MSKRDRILIGQIVGAVGLKGEVKIYSYAESKERFESLPGLFLAPASPDTLTKDIRGKNEAEADASSLAWHDIEKVRYKGPTPIVKLSGIDDRTAAEQLQFSYAYMDEKDLPKLAEGEYYVRDLVGLMVVDEQGHGIGTLEDVRTNTPQKLYVIRTPEGKKVLLPGVDAFIIKKSPEEGKIVVRMPKGLMEL